MAPKIDMDEFEEPETVAGMYTVAFDKETLGFRVIPCSETDHHLRVGLIVNKDLLDVALTETKPPQHQMEEKDQLYALNGKTLEELKITTHDAFAKLIRRTPERPLFLSFISETDLNKSVFDAAGEAIMGGLGFGAGAVVEAKEDEGDAEEKPSSIKGSSWIMKKSSSFDDGPTSILSPRSSMKMSGYNIKELAEHEPDVFDSEQGYHPFSLKYKKYLPLDPVNPDADKVDRGYLEFGKVVVVKGVDDGTGNKGEDAMGVVKQHYRYYNKKKEYDKLGDTCDVQLYATAHDKGFTAYNVPIQDLEPITIHYLPLACGLSLEDFCLYGSCLGCVWGSLAAVFGMLMLSHEVTSEPQTALTTYFYLTIWFSLVLLLVVYIGRTLALITKEEEEAENAEEVYEEHDEEVGLIGGAHDEDF